MNFIYSISEYNRLTSYGSTTHHQTRDALHEADNKSLADCPPGVIVCRIIEHVQLHKRNADSICYAFATNANTYYCDCIGVIGVYQPDIHPRFSTLPYSILRFRAIPTAVAENRSWSRVSFGWRTTTMQIPHISRLLWTVK